MKKTLIITAVFLLPISFCFGQTKKYSPQNTAIQKTIIGFLNWYKLEEENTGKVDYSFTKGGYPDTTTRIRIDKDGVEKYLDHFKKSNFVSETFTDNLRDYFMNIDKSMETMPKYNDLVKIEGMDIDFVLQTFEPEAILDHIGQSRLDKVYIVYNKALVKYHAYKNIDMIFILTEKNKKWLIDYIGHDATDEKSFFRQ